MTEFERFGERVGSVLRTDERVSVGFTDRVMGAVARDAAAQAAGDRLRRWSPGVVRLAMAAGIAIAAFLGGTAYGRASAPAVVAGEDAPVGTQVIARFVLPVEGARSVSLVGSFNDWDAAATPLRRSARSGVWVVELALPPGRHEYAFVVDGTDWRPDPAAPTLQDDFGTVSSILRVGALPRPAPAGAARPGTARAS